MSQYRVGRWDNFDNLDAAVKKASHLALRELEPQVVYQAFKTVELGDVTAAAGLVTVRDYNPEVDSKVSDDD